MFRYQSVLHVFLRLVAFISVPVMLFGKPYLRWAECFSFSSSAPLTAPYSKVAQA